MADSNSIVPSPCSALVRLKPLQQQAIALMMEGLSQVDIARRLGVDRVTVGRWYEREDFKRALAEQMAAVQGAVNAELRDAQLRAVDTIVTLMDAPDAHDRTRLDEAKYLLEAARDMPQPPPVQGVPVGEVMAVLDEVTASYDTIVTAQMGAMYEQLGLCSAAEFLTMNLFEKALLACVAESFATYFETGAIWQPPPDDVLMLELKDTARSHPAWVAAAQQRWHGYVEQFLSSDEYQQHITAQIGHATETEASAE